ncbi:hypothetical protein QL285_079627 [Trifolium repens]|nr:hypothetical protein QL285_079627 [Trifolium repens]
MVGWTEVRGCLGLFLALGFWSWGVLERARSIVSFSLRHRTTVVTAVSDEQPPSHFSHSPFLTEPPYFSSLLRCNVLQPLFIIVPTNSPLLNPKSQIEGLLPLLKD